MNRLAHQRCALHADKQAAARCPRCGRFYCRECVTEHKGKVLCAACLSSGVAGGPSRPVWQQAALVLVRLSLCGLSLMMLWVLLFSVGQWLLSRPSLFHADVFGK